MLSKNNINERTRKMSMQAKQDRFSIRKLTVGTASVLLGFSFLGMSGHTVKADSVDSSPQTSQQMANNSEDSSDVSQQSSQEKVTEQAKQTQQKHLASNQASADKNRSVNLKTFSGLSSYLKSDKDTSEPQKAVANKQTQNKNRAVTTKEQTSTLEAPTTKEYEPADTPTQAPEDSTEVGTWDDFETALKSSTIENIELTADLEAPDADTPEKVTMYSNKNIYGDNHKMNLHKVELQDDFYQWHIRLYDLDLSADGQAGDNYNFYGFDTDVGIELNHVASNGVSYDALLVLNGDTEINYLGTNGDEGHMFSDYSEMHVGDNANINIDFDPVVGTGDDASLVYDMMLIGDNANVNINIDHIMSLFNGALGGNNEAAEVGENSNLTVKVGSNVQYLYKAADPNTPNMVGDPLPFEIDALEGSTIDLQDNAHTDNEGDYDNQIYFLAESPKNVDIYKLDANGGHEDNPQFQLVDSNISGQDMGVVSGKDNDLSSEDVSSWSIDDSDRGQITGDAIDFTDPVLVLLTNPNPNDDIATTGKANQSYQSLGTEDELTNYAANNSYNNLRFRFGTDYYGQTQKTSAGKYDVSSAGYTLNQDRTTSLGTPQDMQNEDPDFISISDSDDPTATHTISELVNDGTITSIEWVPNEAMATDGSENEGGIVTTTDGALKSGFKSYSDQQLGNAVVRITYSDGSYDDVPVKFTATYAQSSGVPQYFAEDHEEAMTSEDDVAKAKNAVSLADNPKINDQDTYWTDDNVTYEWVKSDTDDTPLEFSDLDGAGSTNDVGVKVTYHDADGNELGHQLVAVKALVDPDSASQADITATDPLNTHVGITNVPQFADQDGWETFLDGTLTDVESVSWVSPEEGETTTAEVTPADSPADGRVELVFNDGSAKIVDIQVNVIGAEVKDENNTENYENQTTPAGTLPTAAMAKDAIVDTDTDALDSSSDYDVTYSWAQDADGTVMTEDYVDYAGNDDSKTVPAWVVVTYYKKGSDQNDSANMTGKQILATNLDLTKDNKAQYEDSLTGKTIRIGVGHALTAEDAQNAINGTNKLPEGTTFSWTTPDDVEINEPGSNATTVTVTYPDSTTSDVDVHVTVTAMADIYQPVAKAMKVSLNDPLPELGEAGADSAKEAIVNNADLPEDATYEWTTQPDYSQVGITQGVVTVHYPDDTEQEVNVGIMVNAPEEQTNTPLGQIVNAQYDPQYDPDNPTMDNQPDPKEGISNSASMPEGTTYAWKQPADLSQTGDQHAVVTVTYPDNSSVNVPVVVHVNSDAVNSEDPITQTVYVNAGATAPEAEATIANSGDLENVSSYEFEELVDTGDPDDSSTFGSKPNTVKITYQDGSTKEVPVEIVVKPAAAENHNPIAKPLSLRVGDTVPDAKDAISNASNLPTDATYAWATAPTTTAPGEQTAEVTITYADATTENVEVPVTVVGDSDENEPQGQPINVPLNTDLTSSAKDGIKNSDDLPEGTTYSWQTPPDTATDGSKFGIVLVTYPDGTVDTADVPVNVETTAKGQQTTLALNSAPSEDDAKNAIVDADTNFPNATYAWAHEPDTTTGGDKAAAVTVTPEGGEAETVNVIVYVTSDAETSEPTGEDIKATVGQQLTWTDAKAAITNNADLTNAVSYDFTTQPDTTSQGVYANSVIVTYSDGSTKEVPINVIVSAPLTGSDADRSDPVSQVITVPLRTSLGSDATGSIANMDQLSGNPRVTWVDSSFRHTAANTPGYKQGQVKLTYDDGSSDIINASVLVKAGSDTQLQPQVINAHTGSVVDPKAGIIDGNNLPANATVTFIGSDDIDDTGKVTATPGTYLENVKVKYSDGSSQTLSTLLVVTDDVASTSTPTPTPNPSSTPSGTLADRYSPVGGSISVPVGTDLTNDTTHAQAGIANAAQMPAGTTYKWQTVPDTTKDGAMQGVVLVSFSDGSTKTVKVTVNVGNSTGQAKDVTLQHNAYIYDENGRRINQKVLKIGSVVTTYGKKTINGREFYVLDNNQYLASGNVDAVERKLSHNSYVYNKHGRRVGKKVYQSGTEVSTFGEPVTIRGKKYYIIDNGHYLKANNFTSAPVADKPVSPNAAKGNKTIMHPAYLYDKHGKRTTKRILAAGTKVKTEGLTLIKAKKYYKIGKNKYVAAGNISGTKRTLRRNAFVYSKHANRLNKKILVKGKRVKTYGSPVTIKGKKYYIVGSGKYVKKVNFK